MRLHLEYGAPVWNPSLKHDITDLENVQRRATRVISSLKGMSNPEWLKSLQLPALRFRWLKVDMIERYKDISVCTVLLIPGLRISALSQPPAGFLPKPVAIFLPPSPTPLSVLIRHPSLPTTLCPRLPPPPCPLHPGPGLLDPSSGTPFSPHLPLWLPDHCLHWSRLSLSPTVPLPSVIHPPDQCRPRVRYPLCVLHSPCPILPPYPPLPTTWYPPTLPHWWFGT